MALPDDYIPLASGQFVEFSTSVLEGVLRACPVKDRRDRSSLMFVVSKNTYMDYISALASRMGTAADVFLAGLPNDINYGGVPVVTHDDAADNYVELYGPPNGEAKLMRN